jgi:hypothetical protein
MKQAILILMYLVLASDAQSCSYRSLCSEHTMCKYQVRKPLLESANASLRMRRLSHNGRNFIQNFVKIRPFFLWKKRKQNTWDLT